MDKGCLVISLDYELLWGSIDVLNEEAYAQSNVVNVQEVIDRMLALFEKYQVKATFCTVGMLMCKDVNEVMSFAPDVHPTYEKDNLQPYNQYMETVRKADQKLYFAPDSIAKLQKNPLIEVGTHTFCHYYCWEKGQTIDQFEEDVKAAVRVGEAKALLLKSIIFPRNNVSNDYLRVCVKHGITAYRGNAMKFFSKPKSKIDRMKKRIGRLLDAYIPIAGSSSFRYEQLKPEKGLPVNVPASRFFRPYSKRLFFLEPLRICRIKKEIEYAAKHGEMYHLWWHPHNFGANIEQNMRNLDEVLRCYAKCHTLYDMQSHSMNEMSEIIKIKYGK